VEIKTSNIILYCTKWYETVAFYRDTLKCPTLFSNEWFVEFSLTDTARLSVANEKKSTVKSCQGKGITICLQIEDIDVTHASMEASGLKPTMIKEIWKSRLFYIYDPEGNRIEFWS
jgi:predicted enzyme related to lactoylglutathione lyase